VLSKSQPTHGRRVRGGMMVRVCARRIEYGSGGGRRHQVIMMYYVHDVSDVAPVTLQGEPGSARARGMFGQNRSCDESHALLGSQTLNVECRRPNMPYFVHVNYCMATHDGYCESVELYETDRTCARARA
jgi:hypothetical protein